MDPNGAPPRHLDVLMVELSAELGLLRDLLEDVSEALAELRLTLPSDDQAMAKSQVSQVLERVSH